MKLVCIADLNSPYITKDKIYDGELIPQIYHIVTFQPLERQYMVRCNDGSDRVVLSEHLMELCKFREKQINNILYEE